MLRADTGKLRPWAQRVLEADEPASAMARHRCSRASAGRYRRPAPGAVPEHELREMSITIAGYSRPVGGKKGMGRRRWV